MTRLQATFVIARRDFSATVLSRAFLFFLFTPLFPLLLGGLFGGIGAHVASQTAQPSVAVLMAPADYRNIALARQQLATAIGEGATIRLVGYAPQTDRDAQVKRLLALRNPPIRAVLTGWLGRPQLVGDVKDDDPTARQIGYLLRNTIVPDFPAPRVTITRTRQSLASLAKERALTGQIGQMALFFLTILLAGMLLSQMVEEKSNKIIEVIAAAVPIDTLFLGKLLAMLCASIAGIAVWLGAGAAVIALTSQTGLSVLPAPAVGWPAFLLLGVVYFAMNYMLLGAVFLGIGAQAATVREVQTLSMPVTFIQVLVFGLAALAVGAPHAPKAVAAAIFPLSSPLVMLDRAAELPELWPHFAAIAWQALWVAVILLAAARLFRRTVLKSGHATRRRGRPSNSAQANGL